MHRSIKRSRRSRAPYLHPLLVYFVAIAPALQFSEMIIALLRNQVGRKGKCAASTFGHIMSLVRVGSRISA